MENKLEESEVLDFKNSVEYEFDSIVSRRVLDKNSGTITLFSFDKGQRLSPHSAPFDALLQVLDGRAEIVVGKKPLSLKSGESVIMPANITHSVYAVEPFKMQLTMLKN